MNNDTETEAIKAFWDNSAIIDKQAARIAELEKQLAEAAETITQHIIQSAHTDAQTHAAQLEAENARPRLDIRCWIDAWLIAELEKQLAEVAERNALQAQLDAARLLLVAIDENLDMDVNPLTYTTRRIVELLRDPARNPWAGLMRAGKEERAKADQAGGIAELEAQLDAARTDLARYVAGIDAQRESGKQVLTRLFALVEEWRLIAHSMRDVVGRQSRVAVSMPVTELSGRAAVYETCADALAALLGRNESDEEGSDNASGASRSRA